MFTVEPAMSATPPAGAARQPQVHRHPAITVASKNDPAEHEAERVAGDVMRLPVGATLRRCSCGGDAAGDGECAECRSRRLRCQAAAQDPSTGPTIGAVRAQESVSLSRDTARPTPAIAPPAVERTLATPGRPLDPHSRAYFEPRFGADLSTVRIHDDANAAASAQAVNANAYAVGSHIVFASGRHRPGTHAGDRLLAHELIHVLQSSDGSSRVLHAQGLVTPQAGPTRTALLASLLVDIDDETASTISLRSQLEALPPQSSARRTELEADLDRTRLLLLQHLEQRINAVQDEIEDINRRLGPAPQSVAGRPDLDALGLDLVQRQRELAEHQAQLRPLKRWQTRLRIESVEGEIAGIDAEIATLPQVSDPLHPRAEILALRRIQLDRERRTLAASLTTTATRYAQGDPRWGQRRYGQDAACTNVAAAGCGPTSLAILLNYLFQEDPETVAGPNQIELVTPTQTAGYAETNGRVCNNGTKGDTMVTNVSTRWPGFRGRKISLEQSTTTLRGGNLVIFLCRSCSGTDARGTAHSYGGHFMVLNSVDDQAQRFGVIDPAGANVVSITRAELVAHTTGLWTVERK